MFVCVCVCICVCVYLEELGYNAVALGFFLRMTYK